MEDPGDSGGGTGAADAVPPEEVAAICEGRHGDPFAILGPHLRGGRRVVRAFVPGAEQLEALDEQGGLLGALACLDPRGFFSGPVAGSGPYRLRARRAGAEWCFHDPYAFWPSLGPLDLHLFAEGTHRELGRVFGAQPMTLAGVEGVRFAVWAPNARRVSVVGPFNHWDGRRHPMRLRREAGVWEIFLPGLGPGEVYVYEILGADGHLLPLKADPVGRFAERPPGRGSVVVAPLPPPPARSGIPAGPEAPVSIYEVHAGSWMRGEGDRRLDWDELAERLPPYAADLGFTHIELLPVTEHPFDGSWGYQPIGLFAPVSRLGTPEGFARFVKAAHRAGLGVILDWVPSHFPADAHGPARFDGTALYEHADPREGWHPDWNTLVVNLGRNEVRSHLLSSALHWLRDAGCDGLRVDAVASMLYRDYSRKPGDWVPNIHGGRENLEAIGFLRALNAALRETLPDAVTIAEESTAWPGVSAPPEQGGLGFSYKWNMGWMNDTLAYFRQDPVHRSWHHRRITFGLLYAFSERFVLPLSHDEVVHGKGSLLGKMPGDAWQRFANLRALFGLMWGHPGKKLLFMGGEFAQAREWNHDTSLDWHLLADPSHRGVQSWVRDLNRLYRAEPALHRRDCRADGFRWAVVEDAGASVFAWLRFAEDADPPLLVVLNLTPVPRHGYRIGVPRPGFWAEALNSDAAEYGGSGMGNLGGVASTPQPMHGMADSLSLTLPPLSALFLRWRG
ncbi:MAG: 1,4-alpha-glucan branching protein GlgB [Acetobacteraceae bacterium]|nr:1,4-alpha-glucan branching protein GlgB [Acetobacteraceae bacterium]MDW8397284.1 1,4-alpha-glucan branching protein GlgB [Acetobacteraceae bacterium]